jgi:hypothetical protein
MMPGGGMFPGGMPQMRGKQNPPAGRGGAGGMPGMMPGGMRPGGMPMGAGMYGGVPNPWGLQQSDPEMFKLQQKDMDLERESRQLASQYQGAEKEEREKIKKEVANVVDKQFEVRQERRKLELKRLEEELKRLHEIVDLRAKARKELTDKRVSELIGPEEPGVEF